MKKLLFILVILPFIVNAQDAPENAKVVYFSLKATKQEALKRIERTFFDYYFTSCWYSSDSTIIISKERDLTQGGAIACRMFTAMIRIEQNQENSTIFITGTGAMDITGMNKTDKVIACNSRSNAKVTWDAVMVLANGINKGESLLSYEILTKSE
jgi:hypothetical protein